MIGALIGTLFALLLSPFGMMALLLGFLSFFLLPIIPKATGRGHKLAHFYFWLGGLILKRGAIAVTEQGDLLLKRMSPTGTGTEKMSFNGSPKEFEDPYQEKAHWFGMPFGIANEKHGFFFNLRDAALGRRKKEHEESEGMIVKATGQESSMYEVRGWYRGVLEFPAKAVEMVNLNHVRQLVTGQEQAEDPQRVRTFYKHSRQPYLSSSTTKFIMLDVAIVGPFAALWVLATQLDGATGGTSSVTVSSLALAFSVTQSHKRLAIKGLLSGLADDIPATIIGGLLLVFPPLVVTALSLLYVLGLLFIPVVMLLFRPITSFAEKNARLLTKFGLLGYRQPTILETPDGYTITEYDSVDRTAYEHKHTFLGRYVRFGFESLPELWDTELADPSELEQTMITDGGAKTNLPARTSVIPERRRALMGAFVPSTIDSDKYYLWTDVALGRFKHVATGSKTQARLEDAKEEFGDNTGLSDKTMVIAMSLLGTVSFGLGVFVFFL